jgi:superoxide dismutase, Cu-Zn family
MKRTLVATLAALAAGCTAARQTAEETVAEVRSEMGSQPTATANLIDAQGRSVGRVVLEQEEDGVDVEVHVQGLPPGAHGIHLHQVGTCTPPDFMSTAGHFNPSGREHGFENPRGPHDGDLRNIEVGPDGSGHFELENERVSLTTGPNPYLDADGGAIIIHRGPDDYRTGPTGEGGHDRIACGVFTR